MSRAHQLGRARYALEQAHVLANLQERGETPRNKDGSPWSDERLEAEIRRRLREVREAIA